VNKLFFCENDTGMNIDFKLVFRGLITTFGTTCVEFFCFEINNLNFLEF